MPVTIDGGGGGPTPPSALLLPPQASEPMPDIAMQILGWQDKISLAYGINAAINAICGYNFFEEFAENFTGNWEGFSEAGDALRHTGSYLRAYAVSLESGLISLEAGWHGNAADSASAYIGDLADRLRELQTALDGLGDDFQKTATGVYLAGEAMVSLIQELCDLLIILALEATATASASWTGVGALIGGIASGYTAWEARQVWLEVLTWHGRAVAASEAFAGLAAGNLALLHGLDAKPLPAGYDSPVTP
ncbi:hypothetical protein [Actinotalea solisilvae]|uniref:hypothetical protein n=1 Tax=Actinotalea solisilvae TaxID=2072922 RepID=UPI0018F12375|nr:hypothetical protein [Actinotalea solisilvae]